MIRVLVVDDQPMVAAAHRAFVDRVPGFVTVAVVHDGQAALVRAATGDVDLVLLDLSMPGMPGMSVCRALQSLPEGPEVMVVTAARDLDTVRRAVRHGVVNYVIKPFTFSALRDKLEHYAQYRAAATGRREVMDQGEIDAALAALRTPSSQALPKTLAAATLDTVRTALLGSPDGLTANDAATAVGISRVTARRYLEYLCEAGGCERVPIYGRAGRPELRYRIRPAAGG